MQPGRAGAGVRARECSMLGPPLCPAAAQQSAAAAPAGETPGLQTHRMVAPL